MKKIATIIATLLFVGTAYAQTGNAEQTVNMALSNALEISFAGTGSATGNTVNMSFSSFNDYANGITSTDQQLVVRSNQKFHVRVKANASKFTYTGSTSPAPAMNVSSVLSIKVSSNNTGGTIVGGYSNFKKLSTAGKEIIKNGQSGGNQNFSVQYKTTPGFSFPAGNYTVDIIYTATQA